MNKISVRVADWHRDYSDIRRIREAVFVTEQAVPAEQEWDGEDDDAVHVLACEGDFAVGTARLTAQGEIGRVSVLKDWRGLKGGEALLAALVAEARRRGIEQPTLTAQVQASAFYQRHGFEVISDEFVEAGIAHVEMILRS
ncbi:MULTISPECIES: GNAT family N-acetyltransferase [unclassified Pseudomonas]|uniref:GNAT family N-acetyltransferase n=1 Tax=unclassified Pseudomonas TaxID=196821 RepID=UPI000BCF3852|nr:MULTISPECIES: GNAT family N-acetyltransferase [unclassified Pseudomonas]PVZ19438.1 putative GNAT family N-acyltransferase [Pseudomonas sp. URIL14HWK12:I12]PVZ22977.1 putative GNAT family N-acyltransferase [Pseudomonas sp. URIL14HWK12:I10]PVZ37393.1 putative GNAT family N-acyltransferase [Pseudomonas sp. URIL14HWK12:I11]SNZ14662.1 Predicted N-acyltransferase, GNAT family [Pseudomonas sp. URIL14HWK12:I9]